MISFPWGASPPNPPLHGLRGLRGPVVRGLRGRVAVPGGVRCWLRQKGDSVHEHAHMLYHILHHTQIHHVRLPAALLFGAIVVSLNVLRRASDGCVDVQR